MTQSPCFSVGQKAMGFLDVSTLDFPCHHLITREEGIVAHRWIRTCFWSRERVVGTFVVIPLLDNAILVSSLLSSSSCREREPCLLNDVREKLPPLPSLVPSLSTPAARISLIPNRCRVMTLARLRLLSSVPFYVRQMSCKKLRDTRRRLEEALPSAPCRALIFVHFKFQTSMRRNDTCPSVQECSCKGIASLIVPLFLDDEPRPRRIHRGHAPLPSTEKEISRENGRGPSVPPFTRACD